MVDVDELDSYYDSDEEDGGSKKTVASEEEVTTDGDDGAVSEVREKLVSIVHVYHRNIFDFRLI